MAEGAVTEPLPGSQSPKITHSFSSPLAQALEQRIEIMPDAVRVDRVALCRSYAWYRVVIDDPEVHWTIWKRFSDFSKLRKRLYSEGLLAIEYKDWTPPSLPPKSFLRYSDRRYATG